MNLGAKRPNLGAKRPRDATDKSLLYGRHALEDVVQLLDGLFFVWSPRAPRFLREKINEVAVDDQLQRVAWSGGMRRDGAQKVN
jgi:hypothetical protein